MTETTSENQKNLRKKNRIVSEKTLLLQRLNRAEGQIRGIKKMLENDDYCPDILIQTSAATAALNSFAKELLTTHLKTCVAKDLTEGNTKTLDEIVITLNKMLK
ncbi:MAG: metal-sensing transcriptional repressor [Treponema sp.]|nr:metal-sensing transcriptional repressor [Treponema sp.]